jgi:hypothetical protein
VVCAPGAPADPTASAARVKACPGFSFRADGSTSRATHVKRTSHVTCTKAKNLIRATYSSGPLKVIRTETSTGSHPIRWIAGGWRCSFSPTLAQGGHEAFCRNVKHPSWNEVDAMDAVTAIIPF